MRQRGAGRCNSDSESRVCYNCTPKGRNLRLYPSFRRAIFFDVLGHQSTNVTSNLPNITIVG